MAIRYRVGAAGGRVAKKRPLEDAAMLERVAEILSNHPSNWQIRRRGEQDWSGARGVPATTARLAELTSRGDVGEAWQFRPMSTPAALYVVRKIEAGPPAAPPSAGTAAIQAIHAAYFDRFPNHESWGIVSCRPIAGSATWSQHAWGNAEDLSDEGLASDEAERWFNANRTKLPIAELIGRGKTWTKARASEGWRDLSASANQHIDHWHVSGDVLMTGTPPCAPER